MQEQQFANQTAAISLANVGRFYDPNRFSHQRNALDWLQHQIDSEILIRFMQRWQNPFGNDLPTLQQGDRGQSVTELQKALNRWNLRVIIDGDFGRFTKAAVEQFQRQHGLQVDGIVGAQTWNELFKPAQTIRLAELLRAEETARQTTALEWLQSQLSPALLTEFAKRWRNQVQ